jgi:hypothetical protein
VVYTYLGWTIIRYKKAIWNDGDAYNLQSGVFTAPVDGLYHFDLLAAGNGIGQQYAVTIASLPNMTCIAQGHGTGVWQTVSLNPTLKLKAGQTLAVGLLAGRLLQDQLAADVRDPQYDLEGLRLNQFSGYLLKPMAVVRDDFLSRI